MGSADTTLQESVSLARRFLLSGLDGDTVRVEEAERSLRLLPVTGKRPRSWPRARTDVYCYHGLPRYPFSRQPVIMYELAQTFWSLQVRAW